jgi:hypothetical protein
MGTTRLYPSFDFRLGIQNLTTELNGKRSEYSAGRYFVIGRPRYAQAGTELLDIQQERSDLFRDNVTHCLTPEVPACPAASSIGESRYKRRPD